jgi:hypothetical protein
VPIRLSRRLLALMLVATSALGVTGASADGGVHVIVPPHDPASNWNPGRMATDFWSRIGTIAILPFINHARRAQEQLGPLRFNVARYDRLTIPEQLFVLANLERVSRGETPIYGLWSVLNNAAEIGARLDTDPSSPPNLKTVFWSIWDEATTSRNQAAYFADFAWMYEDGPPPNYFFSAAVCPNSRAPDCWGHRNIILQTAEYGVGRVVLLAGAAGGIRNYRGTNSLTMAFTWADAVPETGITYTWAEAVSFMGLPESYVPTTISTNTTTTTTVPD